MTDVLKQTKTSGRQTIILWYIGGYISLSHVRFRETGDSGWHTTYLIHIPETLSLCHFVNISVNFENKDKVMQYRYDMSIVPILNPWLLRGLKSVLKLNALRFLCHLSIWQISAIIIWNISFCLFALFCCRCYCFHLQLWYLVTKIKIYFCTWPTFITKTKRCIHLGIEIMMSTLM